MVRILLTFKFDGISPPYFSFSPGSQLFERTYGGLTQEPTRMHGAVTRNRSLQQLFSFFISYVSVADFSMC